MITEQQLIGLWSADARYGPGAQEDDLLAFRPDGTGWLAFQRHVLCELEIFVWALTSDGALTFTSVSSQVINPEKPGHPDETDFFLPASCKIIRIEQEITPGQKALEVLTFDRSMPRVLKYGLLTRDMARLDPPLFED